MRLDIVFTIVRKELLETLRDRRTLARLILLPVLLYPLFAIGVSKIQGSELAARQARASKVALWGAVPASLESLLAADKIAVIPWAGAPDDVRRALEAGAPKPLKDPSPDERPRDQEEKDKEKEEKPKPRWTEPENPVLAAARGAVSRRETDAVLVPWPGFTEALAGGREGDVSIYYDSVRADSMLAKDRLERAFRLARKETLAARDVARGLPDGYSRAIDVMPRNVAPERRKIGQILGSVMPMLLILMSLLGSFLPAIDLTAGEKERGTMQTLLCAPLLPIEIIWGKFLAVWCIALLTALANVVSLALTLKRILPGEVPISPSIYGVAFLLLVPVTFLFSALFLSLAVFAKDYKDGQNAVMPAYLPLTLLSGLTALPGVELDRWTAFAPVLNVALLIKAIFLGEAALDLVFSTLASSALYAALALLLAARVFEREHVLLGGRESARVVLGLERRSGGEPSAGFSLTALGVILVLFFYGSLILERFGTAAMLATTQYGFFLLPTIGIVVAFGFSARETLALRLPSIRGAAGALLLGISGWIVVAGLVVRVFPPPESFSKDLERMILLDGKPLLVVLLLTAVTPAICEELLFRGLLFSGLARIGPAAAIVLSSLLFGFAHGSVYRLLPTAFLGLAMGYARLRTRSIVAGMILHVLNNGIAVSLVYTRPVWARSLLDGVMPWSVTAGGVVVFAAGLLVLRGKGHEGR